MCLPGPGNGRGTHYRSAVPRGQRTSTWNLAAGHPIDDSADHPGHDSARRRLGCGERIDMRMSPAERRGVAARSTLEAGTVLQGTYEIVGSVGAGGMGEISTILL